MDVFDVSPETAAPRGAALRPLMSAAELAESRRETADLVDALLRPKIDFGRVAGGDRPMLFKAGAERLAVCFGLMPAYEVVEHETDHFAKVEWAKRRREWVDGASGRQPRVVERTGTSTGVYRIVVRCRLILRATGEVVGEGLAACSTMEGQYVESPREWENTVVQMAEKRAFVNAVRGTLGLSDCFTQDAPQEAGAATAPSAPRSRAEQPSTAWRALFQRNPFLVSLNLDFDQQTAIHGRASAARLMVKDVAARAQSLGATDVEGVFETIDRMVEERGGNPAEAA